MTIEISTAIIISVLSLGFSVFMGLKSNKRTDNTELEERVRENTRINMKLDAISNNTTEIKDEVSEMRKEINSHDNRIIKVEESVKSAHHRTEILDSRPMLLQFLFSVSGLLRIRAHFVSHVLRSVQPSLTIP